MIYFVSRFETQVGTEKFFEKRIWIIYPVKIEEPSLYNF